MKGCVEDDVAQGGRSKNVMARKLVQVVHWPGGMNGCGQSHAFGHYL